MNRIIIGILALCCSATVSNAAIIDFAGGTAYLSDGSSVVTDNTSPYLSNVDYYIEDGIKVDFINFTGIIGDYYGSFTNGENIDNAVIHAHWEGPNSAIVFSKIDGTDFDLNYLDLSSNTIVGGGLANGTELSYITTSAGASMLLPSSDWGIDYISTGEPGDGIKRLWLDNSFDGIASFTVTSQNAYCFGLDNFYIDEPPPPSVPEPSSFIMLISGILGFSLLRFRKR